MRTIFTSLFLAVALFAGINGTAQNIYGIVNGTDLIKFSAQAPGTILTTTPITGIPIGQRIVGIDFRPHTSQLYALGYNVLLTQAQLYVIDTTSGVASSVGSTLALDLGTGETAFDFNPSVDRIRVIGLNGSNYRLHPVTGAIAATDSVLEYNMGDVNEANNPRVAAAAYTNSYDSAATTALYVFDHELDILASIPSPNVGLLTSLHGISRDFDASTDMDVSNTGIIYLVGSENGDDDSLFTVDISTGMLSLVGLIGTGHSVEHIAVYNNGEDLSTGIFNVAAAFGLEVYPNPTTDLVVVSAPTVNGMTVTITDLAGRTVYTGEPVNGNQTTISTAAFAPGMYYLTVDAANGRTVKPIVKH